MDGKGRRALPAYLSLGYIPLEEEVREAFHKREQVSRTLEYGYDFAIAALATALGKPDVAAAFEPSHHIAYLYDHAGAPWRTQEEVRRILASEYGLGAAGIKGNDDTGQMSAWYVFSAVGLYPLCPGAPRSAGPSMRGSATFYSYPWRERARSSCSNADAIRSISDSVQPNATAS